MTRAVRFAVIPALLVILLPLPGGAQGGPGPLPRLAISVPASPADAHAQALEALARCAPAGCRAVAPPADFGYVDRAALERLAGSLPAGTELLLNLRLAGRTRSPSAKSDEAAISGEVGAVVEALPLAHARVRGVVIEVESPLGDPGLLQFAVATFALRARSIRPGLEVTVVFPNGVLGGLGDGAKRIAAYADGVGVTFGEGWREEAAWAKANVQRPVAVVVPAPAAPPADDLTPTYLDLLLDEPGEGVLDTVWLSGWSPVALAAVCRSFAFLARSIPSSFVAAQAGGAVVSLASEGGASIDARRFVAGQSADVLLLARAGGSPSAPRTLIVSHPQAGFDISCFDASDGRRLQVAPVPGPPAGSAARCAADASHALVLLHRKTTEDRVFESVSVAGRAELRVEEVIARWQQYREAQRRALRHYSSSCLLSLHFEPAGMGSGFDVSVRLREFNAGSVREWVQDDFYVNGVRFGNRRGFPLPQLEPEKVVTQPLELSLDERYRYTLEGVDTVDGVPCYVVRIEPTREDETLYSGRIWIDGATFRQVRLALQQRGGRSNVVSHVETQEFGLVEAGGQAFNVFRSIAVDQVLNVAGRSLLLEKRYRFSDYRINDEGFEAEAATARQSDRAMFRDTSEGLRTLKKDEKGRTVETTSTTRIRSLLTGVFYEGTYDFPIPMGGLSLVDFNYRSTGAQLSLFFAGPILALNVSKQQTQRFRFGVDVALSALASYNRRYIADQDVVSQSVRAYEETVGGLASWQVTPSWSLTGSSHLAVNLFQGTSDTAPDFEVPSNGVSLYLTAESKMTRGGYSVAATLMSGSRFGWSEATGIGGSEPLASNYLKYYLEAGKQFYVGSFTKVGLAASYYDGQHLDRFSRYQPSFLSRPRIHGIPGGTDTFDAVGVLGASYGFNVMELVKLEGVYNHAWGRNTGESNTFRNYDGLEFDASTAAPWGTFLQATVAYALRGNIARYNTRWGVYLLVFKPL